LTTHSSTDGIFVAARCGSGTAGVTVEDMGPEWWIVLGVIVLIFGGSQLPKLARSLGQAQKEFKKGLDDGKEPDKEGDKPAAS
jgi:sec-independent protein translocase protein TatA